MRTTLDKTLFAFSSFPNCREEVEEQRAITTVISSLEQVGAISGSAPHYNDIHDEVFGQFTTSVLTLVAIALRSRVGRAQFDVVIA